MPNRAWFRDYVERACTRSARHGSLLAVLFLDLDQFKVVNDSLGHEVGDNLLTAAADRLRLCLRPEDAVARLGGDEFAVLLEDLGDPSDAMRVADRLIEALQAPFLVYSHEVFTSASVGIALSECGADHPQDLLRHAEVAMYQAKDLGRSRVEVFDSHMGVRARERLELEADLRRALRGGELRLQYQPLVTLEAGRMVAVEALVRWQHPREGLLPPGRFISLAEETGLITAVGRWVLEESCRQLRRWQDRYPGAPARVCVNVSPRQLRQPTFLQEVTAIVRAARLDPRCLTIEITEGVLMENRDVALPILEGLRRLGVTVAIDDFGTGYSSLAYLRQYPVDILKIDKSFVDDIGDEAGGTALAGAIIHLAQTLRLQIVAEGIERREQAEQLRRLGCHQGQGYYFGRPYPQDAIEAMLSGSSAPSDGESGARPPTAPAPVP
ncbi:MAG: EAL domain-containing protein [Dehalococcoidia bacterium]